ncbi:MAG: MBL fold metallo-hydrolase [Eubacteriales bacterium]
MTSYRFCTLYSGSGGNAAYLETPGARILIDAGKCARTLVSSLSSVGVPIDTVDAIFVTHEHSDHIAALEVLTRKHPIPVHMLYDSARRFARTQPKDLCACLKLYKDPDFTATVGDVQVTAFPTPHDSQASVGYRFDITARDSRLSVGLATDMGTVTEPVRTHLRGCEAVVLESNHDVEMLMEGPYPYDLKLRIRSRRGHLSNRDCADFAAELADTGTRHILLAHLSEQNNAPELAYDETASALAGTGVSLRVASPTEVTMLVGERDAPIPKVSREVVADPLPDKEVQTV